MKRPPTGQEVDGLIQAYIKEDVLYRQAVAMGLNEDDPVTRRRMAQKLEFITSDLAAMQEPAEGELEQFFRDNLEEYGEPDRISFTQLFFDPDARGDATLADAERVLERLRSRVEPAGEPGEPGDRLMLQSHFASASKLDIQRQFGSHFAGQVMGLEPGQWHGPGFELSIRHPDLDVLRLAVTDLENQLRTYDALYDVRNNLESASEEIQIELKPGAQKLGLTMSDVTRQVRAAYYGEEVQRLPREGQDVKVMVHYPIKSRRSIESLKHFRVRTADGREVPLLSVADLVYAPGIKRIQRGSVGQAEGEARFIKEVMGLYLVAFFVMYAMLAVAFHSYWQPLLILVAMPYAYVGAIYGHAVMGMTMAIFSYFGIAAAVGVVVNDNLVLIDYTNRLRDKGMKPLEAIVEAGVVRFRPIMLTTATTIVGLTPMMLERSIQAKFLIPIVVSLVAGVFIAFFVTLLMVPALYAIGVDMAEFRARVREKVKSRIGRKKTAENVATQI